MEISTVHKSQQIPQPESFMCSLEPISARAKFKIIFLKFKFKFPSSSLLNLSTHKTLLTFFAFETKRIFILSFAATVVVVVVWHNA